jgi:hypothetical protein
MKAIPVDQCNSSPAPKEYYDIPEIKKARPPVAGKGAFIETNLQKLDGYPKSVVLVQWMGAKNGFWYPASGVFRIVKK